MPHARIPTDLLRTKFAAMPADQRAAAYALYVQFVLFSSELLLDGVITESVSVAIGTELGIARGRKAPLLTRKVIANLVVFGLLSDNQDGSYTITNWEGFHSTRDSVTEARKTDAERKRRGRSQLTLGDVRPDVHNGQDADVQPGIQPDSRAHARRSQSQRQDQPRSEVERQSEATRPARANGRAALPIDKQHEVLALLNAIGDDAQDGTNGKPPTIAVLNNLATELPVGALAKVRESLTTARPKPRNRAAYAVAALQAERDSRDSSATLEPRVPHGTPRTP